MYYKIVEQFGPDHQSWTEFLEWRGLELSRFDSVDGILRPDLFHPGSKRDWQNCINENSKWSLITNLEYALEKLDEHPDGCLVGVEIELEADYKAPHGLLGYDIIDSHADVSLLTNWGTDNDFVIAGEISTNGLLENLHDAIKVRDHLRSIHSEDPHAQDCEVWAIYDVANPLAGSDATGGAA